MTDIAEAEALLRKAISDSPTDGVPPARVDDTASRGSVGLPSVGEHLPPNQGQDGQGGCDDE